MKLFLKTSIKPHKAKALQDIKIGLAVLEIGESFGYEKEYSGIF